MMANGISTAQRLGTQSVALAPGTTTEVVVPIPHGEDLARAVGKRLRNVQAQVLTGTAEHTTTVPLNILR
jgi:hypothetical protein